MEAPKCRTCGERHWSRLCPEGRKAVASRKAGIKVAAPLPPEPVVAAPKAPKADRKAYLKRYMRDYMRKRRVKTGQDGS